MDKNFRDSGIESIGGIRWGTHIGYLFSAKTDYLDVITQYIKYGLINNELCLWVYSQNINYEEIISALSNSLEDIDTYIESGQLLIVPYLEWYFENNTFNEVRINNQWKKFVNKALDKGFDGLRAVADTSWLERSSFRTFQHYEKEVNKIIPDLPFLAICLYDANKLDIFEIAEVTHNHSYLITKHENKLEIIENVELLIKDKQLEESEKKYERLLEFLPVAVFIHDENRIYYCNQSALNMIIKEEKANYYNISMFKLISPNMQFSFRNHVDLILSGSKDIAYLQSEFISSDGRIKNVKIASVKYNYQGRCTLLSVIIDLTPFKRINQLEKDIKENTQLLNDTLEYDRIKTEFFSNISHELKTPINVILDIIQLLESEMDTGNISFKESKYLKTMKQNCLRLVKLVNNILDLTKIDSNYYEIKKQNYDIVGLVETITLSVVDYAKHKNITIIFDTNTEEKIVACDPDKIERIILNLLSNAIKFTQPGGNILVAVYDCGEKIKISVKDNGIGIPRDKQKSIFNRFEQVDKSLTRQYEGSGIGLSIVKVLVEKHNGKITLNSELGKGSEFIIEIPCHIIDQWENESNLQNSFFTHNHIERINIELSDIY